MNKIEHVLWSLKYGKLNFNTQARTVQSVYHHMRTSWDVFEATQKRLYAKLKPSIYGGMDGAWEIFTGHAHKADQAARRIAFIEAMVIRDATRNIFARES